MPLMLPCLIFWNTYLKQGIEKWTFKAKSTIKTSQLYTLKYAQVLLQNQTSLMEMEIPIGILHCDCFCDFCFLGINIVNGVVNKTLFNIAHPQDHHNCLTLNPCNVLLQIQIHSLCMIFWFSVVSFVPISASLFQHSKYDLQKFIYVNENIHRSITVVQPWTFQTTSLNTNISIVSGNTNLNPPL